MKTLDAGQAETNKLIEKVEKRVNKEYSQATKDMQKKLNDYLKSFESKDKAMQKQLADGLITEKQYKDWRFGQIMTGKRWQEQLDVLSKDLENSRQIALNIVSGELPSAFAIGHNYGTYLVESGTSLNTSYTLYNRDTVSKLIKDRPKLLPDPTKGSKTAQALKSKQIQKWSKAKMTSAVAQGVLQGEAIPKIASRLRNVTDMSYRASIRNARTMLTSSENLGRQASFERAQDMGIEMEKQWLATLDDRTRDSHALMDGERVPLDENFSNGLEYPADPSGEPEEIYNCRCTMVTAIKGFEKALTDFDLSENEKLHGMSYDEWKDSHLHGAGETAEEVVESVASVWDNLEGMDYEETQELLESKSETLADDFDTEMLVSCPDDIGWDEYLEGLVSGEYKNNDMEDILKKIFEMESDEKPTVKEYLANLAEDLKGYERNRLAYQEIDDTLDLAKDVFGFATKDEASKAMSQGMKKIVDESDLVINITSKDMAKVLEDGTFKNQFEAGHSGGFFSPSDRKWLERDKFNVPREEVIANADRPIYGALHPKFNPDDADIVRYYTRGPSSHYGDGVHVVMKKDSVINNATMTIGDSLDNKADVIGTLMSDPAFSGNDLMFNPGNLVRVQRGEMAVEEIYKGYGNYLEFQLHGAETHTVDCIEKVLIENNSVLDYSILDKLDNAGVPWEVMGSETDKVNVLWRAGRLTDEEKRARLLT